MRGGEVVSDEITIDMSSVTAGLDILPILQKTMPQVMKRIGAQMVDYSSKMVPVDTARLKGSLTHMESDNGLEFGTHAGTNMEYGPYVEFGTGDAGQWSGGAKYRGHDSGAKYTEGWPGMYARPYLRPALFDNEQYYARLVNTAVKDAFKEASNKSSGGKKR